MIETFLNILNWFLTPVGQFFSLLGGVIVLSLFVWLVIADFKVRKAEKRRIRHNIEMDKGEYSRADYIRAFVNNPRTNIPSGNMEDDKIKALKFVKTNWGKDAKWMSTQGTRLAYLAVERAYMKNTKA